MHRFSIFFLSMPFLLYEKQVPHVSQWRLVAEKDTSYFHLFVGLLCLIELDSSLEPTSFCWINFRITLQCTTVHLIRMIFTEVSLQLRLDSFIFRWKNPILYETKVIKFLLHSLSSLMFTILFKYKQVSFRGSVPRPSVPQIEVRC